MPWRCSCRYTKYEFLCYWINNVTLFNEFSLFITGAVVLWEAS
jgi:hypothetical protein